MDRERPTRRGFLAACAGAIAAGTAGCNVAPAAEDDASQADGGTADGNPNGGGAGGETTGDGSSLATPPSTPTPGAESERGSGVPEGYADRFVDVYRATADSVAQVFVVGPRGRGQGTAWTYDEGHVVTNQHVVAGGDDVYVRYPEGGWTGASVVGTDVYSDLAVLAVDDQPAAATPLPLAESDPPVGTEVVAIGNPFGFSGSVSTGVVSGVDRAISGPNNFAIPDAIQTDAPVNPGNSGGPLVDLGGDVVGVVNSGGGDNLGFAISAALVRRVIPELLADGEYDHSYMGIRLGAVGPLIAKANDVERGAGVYVSEVVSGAPADGVLRGSTGETTVDGVSGVPTGGDVIVRMADTPIPEPPALSTFLALETSPGDTVAVTVLRDGTEQTVDLTLGERPEP